MLIMTSYQVVDADDNCLPEDNGELFYLHNKAPQPGYVYITKNVKDIPENLSVSNLQQHGLANETFLQECSKRNVCDWVHSDLLKTGPSLPIQESSGKNILNTDIVFGLKLRKWPTQGMNWSTRQRTKGFPPQNLIASIRSCGVYIVPVSSHHAQFPTYEWRLSFSKAELDILEIVPDNLKETYALGKTLIKFKMFTSNVDVFSSYQFKTSFMWYLESNGFEYVNTLSEKQLLTELFIFFTKFYKEYNLPNYFVKTNNMINHVDKEKIDKAKIIIENIIPNIEMIICEYIEYYHVIPIRFDDSLMNLYSDNFPKCITCFTYNFLAMSLTTFLLHILNYVEKPEISLHYYRRACALQDLSFPDIDGEQNMQTDIEDVVSLNFHKVILEKINELIEKDDLKITEISGISVGLFNIFLSVLPSDLKFIPCELQNYSQFIDILLFSANLHDEKCDRIFKFVQKNWDDGPPITSSKPHAKQVAKLFITVLGRPTKQTKHVNGALLRQENIQDNFILFRFVATFLLHHDLELSYVTFQVVAFLLEKSVLSELHLQLKYVQHDANKKRLEELKFFLKTNFQNDLYN